MQLDRQHVVSFLQPFRIAAAFIFDIEGEVGRAASSAPGKAYIHLSFHGKSAHAGFEPEKGRSALLAAAAAALAIPSGRIDADTTANIGSIRSGGSINVVPDLAEMEAEARSSSMEKLEALMGEIISKAETAAARHGNTVESECRILYRPYSIDADALSMRLAMESAAMIGRDFSASPTSGGSDANSLQALGIDEQSQQALDRMQSERKSWSFKGMILKALTAIMELFFAAAGVILDVLRTFYLIVLSLLGPIAFAISIFDGFQNTLVQWFSKYISIYLWLPISDLFSAIIARLQTLSLQHDAEMMAQDYNWYFDMSNSINLIFILVAICGYLCIPSIASWVVQANGFSSYNRTISRATSLVSGGVGWITGKVWSGTKSTVGGVGKGLATAARLIIKK